MARKAYRADDLVWIASQATNTLGQFLDDKQMPRKAMKALFDEKLVLVNGHKATAKTALVKGDEVRLQMPKEKLDYEPRLWENCYGEFKVLYEDEDLLVIDKPAGVTVNSVGQVSVANGVAQYFKEHNIKRKIRFLNRLDCDTTGCIVIAKSGLAQAVYQQQIEADIFEKWYTALVVGHLDQAEGIIELPMAKQADGIHYGVDVMGKVTRTGYRVLREAPIADYAELTENSGKTVVNTIISEVEVRLYTGKTHQIRVTFAHLGHPLVNDVLYGGLACGGPFQLHAHRIAFNNMRTGKRIQVETE